MRRFKGFTIIELIVVLVLVGIVGVVIASRVLSPNVFNEAAAQDALLTLIRSAQQASLGRDTVTVELDSAGDEWVFTAKAGGTPIRTLEISTSDVVLETGSAVASGNTCATGFDTAVNSDFELLFDTKGDLKEFTNDGTTVLVDPVFNGVRICVNDTVESSVCVSPAGYAYAGNCDD